MLIRGFAGTCRGGEFCAQAGEAEHRSLNAQLALPALPGVARGTHCEKPINSWRSKRLQRSSKGVPRGRLFLIVRLEMIVTKIWHHIAPGLVDMQLGYTLSVP
jgi:hypothetical protein